MANVITKMVETHNSNTVYTLIITLARTSLICCFWYILYLYIGLGLSIFLDPLKYYV